MNKKTIAFSLLAMLTVSLFTAYAAQKDETTQTGSRTYADYIDAGMRITAQAGDVYPGVALDFFKAKEVLEYSTVPDMLEALQTGRVDAALLSDGYVKRLIHDGEYPDFEYLWVPKDVYVNEAGPVFHTTELRDKYNEWFSGIAADGTWQKIVDRWIGVPLPEIKDIPQFEFTGENGILRVVDTGNYPPLIYFDENGEPAGFDVEIVSLFARHMGMKPEFTMMPYEETFEFVRSGQADMSACTYTITDEREEYRIFGYPSVITQAVLVVPKKGRIINGK